MKKTLLSLLFASLGLSLAFAHSDGSPWAFRAGAIYIDEVYDGGDSGWGGTAEIGFVLNGGHSISQRFGLEVGYINSDEKVSGVVPGFGFTTVDLDTDLIPLFANLTFIASCETGFIMEAGAGVGGVIVDSDFDVETGTGSGSGSDDDIVFAGQAFGRLGYEFTDSVSLLAGVRYMLSGKDDILDSRPLDSFAFDLNLQFRF